MHVTAKDIMVQEFETIRPEATVVEAARRIFDAPVRASGFRTVALMVTDEDEKLVGVISMFDILYRLRPSFLNYDVEALQVWNGEIEAHLEQLRDLSVRQAMTAPVITARAEDHIMVLIDRMIKRRARRLPVVEDRKIIGVVYLMEVFHGLCKSWLQTPSGQ
ncbi:HPP family protein [Thermodesulfobacteriota bacterium]